MTLEIEFIPVSKDAQLLVPAPKPAKNYIPQWYKDIQIENKPQFDNSGDITNENVKHCVPFLDALTQGYIQESWTDIYIEFDGKALGYHFPVKPAIMGHRNKKNIPLIENIFYDTEFVWNEQWIPKLPKGYSALYTSPLNYFTLPFRSLDAVIDSDNYYHEYTGQYPFYIYKGFVGLIPAGTPLYQIIPIKRDDWKSKNLLYNEEQNKINNHKLRKHYFRSYKTLFWQKKRFD